MTRNTQSGTKRGVAVSDLHLFARRSIGAEYFESLRPQLRSADILLLNGDIFDFRWSTLPTAENTVAAALEWLHAVAGDFPHCEIHYVLGNHDCPTFFRTQLDSLQNMLPRFHCHPYGVRLGPALFVHGDCTHRKMDSASLRRYREAWDNHRRHGRLRSEAYTVVDRLGLTWLTHRGWFPQQGTVERVVHYLDRACPGWRERTRECYFGHTHLPFSDHRDGDVIFHNTGSGIRGMGFNPKLFSAPDEPAESLS